jgi:2,3-diketo-5-methylthio-1-phosphopentane phosphatase
MAGWFHGMQANYSVFCDFDGTVSVRDATDVLLEAYALPQWRLIEKSWRAGNIGSMECMRRQVALLRCSRKELDDLVDQVAIDPGFADFVLTCREAAVPVVVLSDGLDYVIGRVLRNNGLSEIPFYANRLEMHADGSYSLAFPQAQAGCIAASGTCKCALMRALHRPGAASVLVGDGASDFCAAREAADFVFAKDSLLEHCRRFALPHGAYEDFRDVTRLLFNLKLGECDSEESSPVLSYAGYPQNG